MIVKPPDVFGSFDDKHELQVFHLSKGEGVPPHAHQDYSHDLFIIAGEIQFMVGSIVKRLKAPDTVHFPNGALHTFEALVDGTVAATLHPRQ